MKTLKADIADRRLADMPCSARSRNYRGKFYITIQDQGCSERKAAPGTNKANVWKKLATAQAEAQVILSWWDVNGKCPAILRIYDDGTLIEAHYWQNASDQ